MKRYDFEAELVIADVKFKPLHQGARHCRRCDDKIHNKSNYWFCTWCHALVADESDAAMVGGIGFLVPESTH